MPYVTKHTFKKIIQHIDLAKIDFPSKSKLCGIDFWMLTTPEKKRLLAIKELFSDVNFDIDKCYRDIPKPKDSLSYVFPEKPPSYHRLDNCNFLKTEYSNFEIPVEIKAKGQTHVYRFRKWFKENGRLLDTEPEKFLIKLEVDFLLKNPPKAISAPNSGRERLDNFSLDDLHASIEELFGKAEKLKYQNSGTTLLINKFGSRSFEPPSDPAAVSIIKHWHEIKSEIKETMTKYLMVKFNPKIELNGLLLDRLGVQPCRACHSLEQEIAAG